MERRNARKKAKEVEGSSKIVIALLALATLCVGAVAQEDTADKWYNKGLDLGRNGSYEEAVKAYNCAIALEPNNATFYTAIVPNLNTLAFIANNQSKRNESMKAIDKALQIDPGNPLAWEMKGEVLYQMEKYNESVDAYDKAIKNIGSYRQDIHANQTEFLSYIWTSESISLWQLMRYNESLAAVDKAVQIDPAGNYDAWAFKGELLASLGRYNESIQAYDEALHAIDQKPGSSSAYLDVADAWFGKAEALVGPDRVEEAADAYSQSLLAYEMAAKIDPESAKAWTGKGNVLLSLKLCNESKQAYERALEILSQSIETNPNTASQMKMM